MGKTLDKRYEKAPGEKSEKARPAASIRADSVLERRDFLKLGGFTLATVATGCVRGPVGEAIPLLETSPEMVPGSSAWYASTCHGCTAGCGAVARSRDGRPIQARGQRSPRLEPGGAVCRRSGDAPRALRRPAPAESLAARRDE